MGRVLVSNHFKTRLAPEWLAPKGNLSLLEANKALGTEPLAVASGTKTQAENQNLFPYLIHEDSATAVKVD